MADYPCDLHLSRYAGPSTRMYVNLYREELELKLKVSVCPDCLAACLAEWFARALLQDGDGYWNPVGDDMALEAAWRPRTAPSRPLRRVG